MQLDPPRRGTQLRSWLVGVLVIAHAQLVAAESPPPLPESEATVEVAASERYQAGRVYRFALGGGYRDLWERKIELPVLDLERIGGGLEPTRRFGGLQTAVLGFKGADGRTYSFRGTDKDPSAVLDALLKDTIVQTVVQDQMAAQHPGGPPVAGVLTSAAGVLTVHERMVVMPDDPRLAGFREEFAGMVGTFFEYPQPAKEGRPGFHGATEIIDHEGLYEKLASGNQEEVDVEAFLRARLLDLLLGDFDRHRKQWRWARLPGSPRWQPIPEDRDMAFVRYDGVGLRIAKIYIPILQRYDEEYPFIKGLTLHGWEQDRWLLPNLEWSVWPGIVADIQTRLTDEKIDEAIATLPAEYRALDAERMRRDIRGRRDRLLEAARAYYEHLAREVDVQTSDASDAIHVVHHEDGRMTVTARARSDAGAIAPAPPHFERTFDGDETKEVRIYLRGGDDVVVVEGRPRGPRLRIVTDEGTKTIDDALAGKTRIYDEARTAEVLPGPGTHVERAAYELPPSDSGFVDVDQVPPRDWGSDTIPLPEFGYEKDVGVFIGAAVAHTRYAFRKHPWASSHSLSAGYATEADKARVRYRGRYRQENSKRLFELDLQYSGIEVIRFYGFGNETDDDGRDRFFRVRNQTFRALPSYSVPLLDEKLRIKAGPYAQFSNTSNGDRLIDRLSPYGDGRFGLVGASVSARYDTRQSLSTRKENLEFPFSDNPAAGYPTRGFFFDFTARISPPVWDVEKTYGSLDASIAGFFSLGEHAPVTLALRLGGRETFGRTPYFDAAYIGGGRFFSGTATDRGYRTRRFAGDTSVYLNTDLRVVIGRAKIIVPGDYGIQGFFDVGRVFLDDQRSDRWHPSGGGGLWFSPLVRTNTISVSVAGSEEEVLAYLRFGFHY